MAGQELALLAAQLHECCTEQAVSSFATNNIITLASTTVNVPKQMQDWVELLTKLACPSPSLQVSCSSGLELCSGGSSQETFSSPPSYICLWKEEDIFLRKHLRAMVMLCTQPLGRLQLPPSRNYLITGGDSTHEQDSKYIPNRSQHLFLAPLTQQAAGKQVQVDQMM